MAVGDGRRQSALPSRASALIHLKVASRKAPAGTPCLLTDSESWTAEQQPHDQLLAHLFPRLDRTLDLAVAVEDLLEAHPLFLLQRHWCVEQVRFLPSLVQTSVCF